MVVPGVAKVGSVFPRVWASIWRRCRKKARETVQCKKKAFGHIRKMRPEKCARDWSEPDFTNN